jgi:hypothetical protein
MHWWKVWKEAVWTQTGKPGLPNAGKITLVVPHVLVGRKRWCWAPMVITVNPAKAQIAHITHYKGITLGTVTTVFQAEDFFKSSKVGK